MKLVNTILTAITNKWKNYWIKKYIKNVINDIEEGELRVNRTPFMTNQVINKKLITINGQSINKNNLNLYIKDKEEDTLSGLRILISMALEENPKAKIQVYTTNNQ